MNGDYTDQKMPALQRMAAKNLSKSYETAVHVTITAEAKLNGLKTYLALRKKNSEQKQTLTGILIYSLAKAVCRHPFMNCAFVEGQQRHYHKINIGLAVAGTDGTLTVPVLSHADQKSLQDIEEERHILIELARKKKLKLEHLQGATLTMSNVGIYPSIRYTTPIIPLGQGAILATGALYNIFAEPSETTLESWRLPLSLSFDHRIINGLPATEFLQTFVNILESY